MSSPIFTLSALCRVIRYGVCAILLTTLAAHLWIWLNLEDVKLGVFTFIIHIGDLDTKALSELAPSERLATILISVPALIFLSFALIRLIKLMRYFERKEYFIMPSILLLRGFCGAMFIYVLYSMFEPIIRYFVFDLLKLQSNQLLVLHLTDSFDELLLCGLFYVIARIMEEGRRLAEENSEFI